LQNSGGRMCRGHAAKHRRRGTKRQWRSVANIMPPSGTANTSVRHVGVEGGGGVGFPDSWRGVINGWPRQAVVVSLRGRGNCLSGQNCTMSKAAPGKPCPCRERGCSRQAVVEQPC
jgi:hypothetical protein